jgi:hypothetical protein
MSSNKNDTTNTLPGSLIKFKTIANYNNLNEVDPILELYKGKLYSCLIKLFTNDCVNIFGTQIFSIKKSFTRTLTNLLSSWMFSLYADYDFSDDFFFPTNYSNTFFLENTLIDLCKYDNTIVNPYPAIQQVVSNLKNNYKYQLDLLNKYKKSFIYTNNKSNYKIKKTMIDTGRSNELNMVYKFEIFVNFIIKDKRLINILENVLLPVKLYNKLSTNYTGPKNKVDDYLWAIIFRYQLLGSNNHQLAVLPNVMKQMKNDYNLNFECFASSINSTFKQYCSIYWDLEKHFGSVGSFFNIIPSQGTFGFNPPYQKDIINKGIHKLFNFLEQATDNLTFIITVPIWDLEGRKYVKEHFNNDLEKQNIDYGDFPIIQTIKNSIYFRGLKMISKENFTYIDHNFSLYKNKTIQNTYVIILSNTTVDIKHINEYDFENNYEKVENINVK